MKTTVTILCEDGIRVTAFGPAPLSADVVQAMESIGLQCAVASIPSGSVMGGSTADTISKPKTTQEPAPQASEQPETTDDEI
jgi:hypothetical protein